MLTTWKHTEGFEILGTLFMDLNYLGGRYFFFVFTLSFGLHLACAKVMAGAPAVTLKHENILGIAVIC